MTTMDRRRLLTAAALGGAGVVGATALGSLAPEAAFADPVGTLDPAVRDPNFAEGRVSAINERLLLVSGSDGVLHRIQVTNGTSVWKLRPTTFDRVELGDGLYARGVQLGDGTLAAESLWVNIVSLDVGITNIANGRVSLDHHGKLLLGHVVPGTTSAVYDDQPATTDLSRLQVGWSVHVIGAWLPDTDEVDLATIYAHT
jgi:hypothetical protein